MRTRKAIPKVTIYIQPDEDPKEVHYTLHHRKPRSRGGTRNRKNLSRVDWSSHMAYNMLATATANCLRIPISSVRAVHLAKFLKLIMPPVARLLVDPATRKLKPFDQIAREFNTIWLEPGDAMMVTLIAESDLYKPKKKSKV